MSAAPARRRPGADSPIKLTAQVEEVRTAATLPVQAEPVATEPAAVQTPQRSDVQRSNARTQTAPLPAIDPDATEPATFNIRKTVKKTAETAVLRTGGYPGGYTSMKALVEGAIERELVRLAEEFNGGEAFPPNEGGFRRGRPFGS